MKSTLASDSPLPVADAPPAPQPNKMRRVIIASSLGNGLEIYDFTVYSFFAVIIGQLFFPGSSPMASLLMSLATFAVGFVMRPLGALLIGRVADRRGRKAALSLTIALMTVGTGIIAFTPTYASIGISASVLLVIARLLQGLSVGGEVGCASAFMMESGRTDNRCFVVSWQGASQGAAALLGAGTGLLLTSSLSEASLLEWGWRVPFVIGLLIGPVGWFIRQHLDETHTATATAPSLGQLLKTQSRILLLGIAWMSATTVTMYMVVYYMPTYLTQTLGRPQSLGFALVGLASALLVVITPIAGRYADGFIRRKPLLYGVTGLALLTVYPAFMLLSHENVLLCIVAIILLILPMAIGLAPSMAMLLEAFPREQRVTGMSIIYSVSVTLFGGFSPLLVTWLINVTGNPLTPALYLVATVALSLCALRLLPEHPGRD
ncbi:MFS transporter [Pseudomonas sp. CFBP 13727]|uniref:MFS transporter n=1 Tax=Pseudomonas sp. CFBP 13727 TaxID=2775295 RepID=UPI00177C829D|nr:MFS transporter [Pseudomonas sp. CFBP 13727]MBD8622383.1 MFS transporter [Pseudomonas sp. CFBP 13727]